MLRRYGLDQKSSKGSSSMCCGCGCGCGDGIGRGGHVITRGVERRSRTRDRLFQALSLPLRGRGRRQGQAAGNCRLTSWALSTVSVYYGSQTVSRLTRRRRRRNLPLPAHAYSGSQRGWCPSGNLLHPPLKERTVDRPPARRQGGFCWWEGSGACGCGEERGGDGVEGVAQVREVGGVDCSKDLRVG